MRKRIVAAVLGVAMLAAPVAAQGYHHTVKEDRDGNWRPYEKRYLRLYDRYAEELGKRAPGRNIVLFGVRKRDGDAHEARKPEVLEATSRMRAVLGGGMASTGTTAGTAASSYGAAASSSTAQCESGGDYGAVNPAGYYGAYQFDQSTWDAYAPEGYAGTNPATAPPAVQDAAAANVPYDAWPNC